MVDAIGGDLESAAVGLGQAKVAGRMQRVELGPGAPRSLWTSRIRRKRSQPRCRPSEPPLDDPIAASWCSAAAVTEIRRSASPWGSRRPYMQTSSLPQMTTHALKTLRPSELNSSMGHVLRCAERV
jgi:hypothetical protein